MLLAIDPGKDKCGLAILDDQGQILKKKIVPRPEIEQAVRQAKVNLLIIGESPFGRQLEKDLARLDLGARIVFVTEKNSTLEARQRYWRENKAKGLWRLLPASLRPPPAPVDDYAAVILGERYLKK